MRFKDEVVVIACSGRGGNGSVSFRREKFVPRGGPDGGDGGAGGSIIFQATTRRNTLVDYRRNKMYKAPKGGSGLGKKKTGADGKDCYLLVPLGTIISNDDTGEVIADLSEDGAQWLIPGGAGGLGNVRFKSARRRTPRKATAGKEGEQYRLRLELKLIADVGLLGFPNAGKSTLISRISAARPKIADYPFTTLIPNLGVVQVGDEFSFVVADIPGLIEGAAEGAGLGHEFLKHIERCRVYIHMLDPVSERGTPAFCFARLNEELEKYDVKLMDRPQLVVVTKADILSESEKTAHIDELKEAEISPIHVISSVSGEGLPSLLGKIVEVLKLDVDPSEDGLDDTE